MIAQGIQKGIDLYKRQQKAKARELDRKLKSLARQQDVAQEPAPPIDEKVPAKRAWLPWALLVLTWMAIVAYFLLR